MKEYNEHSTHHNHSHDHETHDQEFEVVPQYKEEGAVTVETLNVASHEAHTLHHRAHKRGFTLTTPIAILLGAVIIAGGIVAYGFITQGGSQAGTQTNKFLGRPIDDSDYVDGKIGSNVVVMEYSDPECPFCVQASPVIKQLRSEYGNRVAFVYRYFPLTQIHPHAFDESRAIACAGSIGGADKFYKYIDTLFSYKMNNKTTELPLTGKEDIAKTIGLDITAFSNCMKNKETDAIVTNSINDGVAAGVQGTPTSFVLVKNKKGYDVVSLVDGARPYTYFKAAIEEALTK